MMNKNNVAFTIVELIIMILILTVLAIVGVGFYLNHAITARDWNRISQLSEISQSLSLYMINSALPVPDNNFGISANGNVFYLQWYAWKNVIRKIKYTGQGFDPKDHQYFSYTVMKNKNYYQLMAYLELKNGRRVFSTGSITNRTTDYNGRFAYTLWSPLGMVIQKTTNSPAQDFLKRTSSLSTMTWWYIAMLSNSKQLSWTGIMLIQPNYSCARIKEIISLSKSGYYTLDPLSDWTGSLVYCNM